MACGRIALGVSIDAELPKAKLTQIDLTEVKNLRAQISDLAAAGNEKDARELEEKAMKILGYEKAWLRCGPGSFTWRPFQLPAQSKANG